MFIENDLHDMPTYSESQLRLFEKLYRDLTKDIVNYLEDKEINEVMLNPDGKLWIDSSITGMKQVGYLTKDQATGIINAISGIHEQVISYNNPRLEAPFPIFKALQGQRFTAQIPPIVVGPSFTIRKRSEIIYTLDDYLKTQRMTQKQADLLTELVHKRANILVCGGPGSGKTTVTNALIVEAVKSASDQRFILLEDQPELQCQAKNTLAMLTSSQVSMTELLRTAMRSRPDRILIGEVRGAEALDMLKAWNTGCPGGICTVHANGVDEAIQRISDLAMEAGLKDPPLSLIKHTIHAVVSVTRKGHEKGFISDIKLLGEIT